MPELGHPEHPPPAHTSWVRCPGCASQVVRLVSVHTSGIEVNGLPLDPADDEEGRIPSALFRLECALCTGGFDLYLATVAGRTGAWMDDAVEGGPS